MLIACLLGQPVYAQMDEARQAMDKGDFIRAISVLSDLVANHPSPEAFLDLGIAYRNIKEYEKAEQVLEDGSARFESEPAFHIELAAVYQETRDIEKAKAELHRALDVDPHNSEASDTLAAIDISEGEIQSALRFWNRSGRPVIENILHNYYLSFGSWVVRDSIAFTPSEVLHYPQWKTTEARLFETNNFTNIGLEVEPTKIPDHFDAIVRTTPKTNKLSDLMFGLLKGAPVATSFLDVWNIGNTGLNWNSMYRWDQDRRRAEGTIHIPIPVPGILNVEISDIWRNEHWDLSPSIRPDLIPSARFDYRSNAVRLSVSHIPHYRVELGGGFEYVNRSAQGDLPQIGTDRRDSGKLFFETAIRLVDRTYQNRLRIESFIARKSIAGDFNYSGGTAELDNRVTISKDSRTYLDWTIKGGTSRGQRPVEDYFVLGLDTHPDNLLRGHTVADHGRYGNGPAGTDFMLGNLDIERRLVTIPMFDTFNLPYIQVKAQLFLDSGRTWDRTRVFKPSKLLVDTGGELRLETPANTLSLVYGRSLRDGKTVLFGYVEHKLW